MLCVLYEIGLYRSFIWGHQINITKRIVLWKMLSSKSNGVIKISYDMKAHNVWKAGGGCPNPPETQTYTAAEVTIYLRLITGLSKISTVISEDVSLIKKRLAEG